MNTEENRWFAKFLSPIALIIVGAIIGFLLGMLFSKSSEPDPKAQTVVRVGLPLEVPLKGEDFGFPPENVKALVARGVRSIAVLDESDTIRGVASLNEDGVCLTCQYIGNGGKVDPLSSGGTGALDDMSPIGSVCAAGTCPNRRCGCGSGRCRTPAGHCCNC